MVADGDAPRPPAGSLWLTVDRGNTTLDCMLADGEGRVVRARMAPTATAFGTFLGARRPDAAAGVTVIEAGLAPVLRECEARGVRLLRAGVELPCSLRIAYRTPQTLGADRWVAALAAHERFGAAVVVDCGTAVTVDAVRADGTYLGGAIAPGAAAMAAGLARRAPALPAAELERGFEMPPSSTVEAVAAGVQLGFAGAVDGLVRRVARHVPGGRLVLTGGEAGLLLRHTELEFAVLPDLVHEGLRCLLRASRS